MTTYELVRMEHLSDLDFRGEATPEQSAQARALWNRHEQELEQDFLRNRPFAGPDL